jgi:hypothetical protein
MFLRILARNPQNQINMKKKSGLLHEQSHIEVRDIAKLTQLHVARSAVWIPLPLIVELPALGEGLADQLLGISQEFPGPVRELYPELRARYPTGRPALATTLRSATGDIRYGGLSGSSLGTFSPFGKTTGFPGSAISLAFRAAISVSNALLSGSSSGFGFVITFAAAIAS